MNLPTSIRLIFSRTDSDRYKHRFVYFVYLGQTLLHAAYLPSMSTEDAQLAINGLNLTRPYTVYSEDSLTMARNLRRSFTLSLRSRVMKADVARFNDPLRQLWQNSFNGYRPICGNYVSLFMRARACVCVCVCVYVCVYELPHSGMYLHVSALVCIIYLFFSL